MKPGLFISLFTFVLLASCVAPPAVEQNTPACDISDKNLKEAVQNQLNISGAISCSDLERLSVLDSQHSRQTGTDKMIVSLEGLQYATNLQELKLASNQIKNVSPLANLRSLKMLHLEYNKIEDISALSKLNKLEALFINDNMISDISSISLMPNLVELNIGYNKIANISALAGLTKLRKIAMIDNLVSDISIMQNQLGYSRKAGYLLILDNCLDLSNGSDDLAVLDYLAKTGTYLQYEPQKSNCE